MLRILIGPIKAMSRVAEKISQGDLDQHLRVRTSDEVGTLAQAFNQMSENLKKAKDDLIEANLTLERKVEERTKELKDAQEQLILNAHRAGMADIATGVLHNIGNALNSIGVRLEMLTKRINQMDVRFLRRIHEALTNNQGHLDAYLSTDRVGMRMLPALSQILDGYEAGLQEMSTDHGFITHKIQHVIEIILLQQSYAGSGSKKEHLDVVPLVNDAVAILGESLAKRKINVVNNILPLPALTCNKYELSQVFVNLIKNAMEAIDIRKRSGDGLITIDGSIYFEGGRKGVLLTFRDNGIGIEPERLTDLFKFGFTTKAERGGKGFGLHSCDAYIRSSGGYIRAVSEGVGKGATFKIWLPVTSEDTPSGSDDGQAGPDDGQAGPDDGRAGPDDGRAGPDDGQAGLEGASSQNESKGQQ
jgi:signal transduction histidine kinase